MFVEEDVTFFAAEPAIGVKLEVLNDLGLVTARLANQPRHRLAPRRGASGSRRSSASFQRSKHTLYILNEPTTGLHLADVIRLLESLNRLVDAGHTVVRTEHHLDAIKTADHVIDLGFEGAYAGGNVVVTGTPEVVAACKASHTGRFLAAHLSA